MRLVKLDKRHTCHEFMQYYIEPKMQFGFDAKSRFARFQVWREWCWEVFGPGVERHYIRTSTIYDETKDAFGYVSADKWAWYTENGLLRLYFRDEETASAFSFQWS